jgi:tRNA (mo5U34)-methyltransferase
MKQDQSVGAVATKSANNNKEEILQAIAGINWFHQIDLGHGVVTKGTDVTARKIEMMHFPDSFAGKSFIDIGAWDGAFSFEAERRGAKRVLATDSFVWDGNVPGKSNAGFLAARKILNSRVEDMKIDPFDISPSTVGMWDIVFLSGVVYHVKNPWLLIERAASVTRELLIVETATDLRFTRRPAIMLYPAGELVKDPTNWCAPNIPALRAMLKDCGFKTTKLVNNRGLGRAILLTPQRLFKFGMSPIASLQQGRVVMHARR